jgi:hypothetical protein
MEGDPENHFDYRIEVLKHMAVNEKEYVDYIEGDMSDYLLHMATEGVKPDELIVRATCEAFNLNLTVHCRHSHN